MSLESATQRLGELQALTGAVPAAPAVAMPAAAPGAFDAALARAGGQGTATLAGVPASSVASGVPLYRAPVNVAIPYAPPPPWAAGAAGAVAPFATAGGVGQRIVALAQAELGVTESPPGSNDGTRIAQYRTATKGAANTPGPWCAYFVSWLARQAGAPIGAGGDGTGYVPTLESWGRSTGRFREGSQELQPGDIVIFDRNGDGLADHTGIVERVAGGQVHTIEGNTSDGVARRSYAVGSSQIKGVVRAA